MSKNKKYCLYLIKLIEENPKLANDYFNILNKNNLFKDLCLNEISYLFIQKIIKNLNIQNINELITQILKKNFLELCLNKNGSLVIQILIEKIYDDEKLVILFNHLLSQNLLEIILNEYSNEIIMKYFSLIKFPLNNEIFLLIQNNLIQICLHKFSVIAIEKVISELKNNEQKFNILFSIASITNLIIYDQFGSLLIQKILNLNIENINKIIIQQYLFQFNKNACQKFSSFLFDQIFSLCNFETKQFLIKNICNIDNIKLLLFDFFGNYVLLNIINSSIEPYKTKYLQIIAMLFNYLKLFPIGNNIIQKYLISFPHLIKYLNFNSNNNNSNFNNFINQNNFNSKNYFEQNKFSYNLNNQIPENISYNFLNLNFNNFLNYYYNNSNNINIKLNLNNKSNFL